MKRKNAKRRNVLLPCDPKQNPILYYGRAAIGSIISVEDKLAVVALAPNTSDHKFTEGYIYVPDNRMEPNYKKGDKVAICRKHPMHCFWWGYDFYIVDQRRKVVLCTLYPNMKKQGSIILQFNNKQYRSRMPLTKSMHGFYLVEPFRGWPND